MDTLNTVFKLINPNCFFAKLDLKDAYYSIAIHPEERKNFRFKFQGTLFEYCALPQGYTEAPRLFTKLLKIPLAFLRSLGHINSGHLDDIYLQGDSFKECLNNIYESAKVLDNLGFTIHMEKSIFIPQQKMEFLGFILDSQQMLVLPNEKKMRENKRNM